MSVPWLSTGGYKPYVLQDVLWHRGFHQQKKAGGFNQWHMWIQVGEWAMGLGPLQ